jgi:hypothetical protein
MVNDALKELDAMKAVMEGIADLSEESAKRVLVWVCERYGFEPGAPRRGSLGRGGASGNGHAGDEPLDYQDLSQLYEAANPKTENEKVLVASFYLHKVKGIQSLESAAVNKELRELGHPISNITKTYGSLIKQKPALAIQTKSGSGKRGRKKYRLTVAGINAVEKMLGRALSNAADVPEEDDIAEETES